MRKRRPSRRPRSPPPSGPRRQRRRLSLLSPCRCRCRQSQPQPHRRKSQLQPRPAVVPTKPPHQASAACRRSRFDAEGLDVSPEEMICLLDVKREGSIKCRHYDGRIPCIPRIFITNLDPHNGETIFPKGKTYAPRSPKPYLHSLPLTPPLLTTHQPLTSHPPPDPHPRPCHPDPRPDSITGGSRSARSGAVWPSSPSCSSSSSSRSCTRRRARATRATTRCRGDRTAHMAHSHMHTYAYGAPRTSGCMPISPTRTFLFP